MFCCFSLSKSSLILNIKKYFIRLNVALSLGLVGNVRGRAMLVDMMYMYLYHIGDNIYTFFTVFEHV